MKRYLKVEEDLERDIEASKDPCSFMKPILDTLQLALHVKGESGDVLVGRQS